MRAAGRGLGLAALIACGSEPAPAPKKTEPVTLSVRQLGLRVVVPPGAVVGNASLTAGALVSGQGISATTVVEAPAGGPKTLDDKRLKIEELAPLDVQSGLWADGWWLTWRTRGPDGEGYWLFARREIGGRSFDCWTTAPTAAERDTATPICLGLQA